MLTTRRWFLEACAAVPAVMILAKNALGEIRMPLHPQQLAKFVDAMPVPARMKPTEMRDGLPLYRVVASEQRIKVHRDVPETMVWAYGDSVPGATIHAKKNNPFLVEWVNHLPEKHFLPIDHNLHGAGRNVPESRIAVHVHGAVVKAEDDGFPDDWQKPGESRVAHYPMEQDGATLWYHDHAMGIERLNVYAGMFGFLLVEDEADAALPTGEFDVPISLADRSFFANGGLNYPTSGDPNAPWVSEVYADATLVNGKLFPYFEVEPRAYRLRLLNASNTRIYSLTLSDGSAFTQVGSDQGMLPAAVSLPRLQIAPAERCEIVIDFSKSAGSSVQLHDIAHGPVLQFRVKSAKPEAFALPSKLREVPKPNAALAIRERMLTLDEYMDPKTRIMLMLLNGKYWHDEITEKPMLDSTEIWSFVNLTEDLHPIHLHLVRFQVLDRRPFDVPAYRNENRMAYVGPAIAPEPGETGWKDTVQAAPEHVTRILVKFSGYIGRYVWHCHLLEHAANEMMRPFEVVRA